MDCDDSKFLHLGEEERGAGEGGVGASVEHTLFKVRIAGCL